MNVKIKIALNGIAQKLSRESITPEQAAAHFKKVTGENLADYVAQADPEVGKFLAYLEGAYPVPAAQVPEAEQSLEDLLAAPETIQLLVDWAKTEPDEPAAPQDPETEAPAAAQDPETESPAATQDPEADEPAAPQDPEADEPTAPQDPEADEPTAPQDPEAEAAPAVTEERPKRTRKPAGAK